MARQLVLKQIGLSTCRKGGLRKIYSLTRAEDDYKYPVSQNVLTP